MSDQEAAGEPEPNAAAIVAVLNKHQVRYVIIRSKESAGRPKDLRVLPLLYRPQAARGSGTD